MTAQTADGVAQKVPVITTQAFNIVISRGVARTLPAEPTNDVYEQIVNTLTLLSQDISKISGIYPPASIKDIGEAAVTYDTTDGVTLKTTEQWAGTNGETFDIETERELPIKGGKNIAIGVTEDGKFIEVKSTADPIEQDEKGKPGGVPTLDSNGQIPSSQLPTYVDDVIDGYVVGSTPFAEDWLSKTPNGTPLTPEKDKIYIVVSEGEYINTEYRWSGTVYAELGKTTPLSGTTGQGTNIGMTQKAITDELAKKQDKLAIYTVNTAAEVTISADDLAKIKADNNAIIVEIDTTRPSAETRFYKKGIDFIGGTVFVSIYTVVGAEVAEGCSIAYRELNPTTGVLTARHETNATSLAEVRQEIEGKYLPKPSGNPTEDSLVKVSSAGTSSWQPVSDFLAIPTSAANSDRVCIVPDGQTKFGYKNAYKTVYNVENVFVIRDVRGTVPQPDPQREQDGVNLRYLQANYNGNPTLDGTEAELTGVTLNGTKYKVPSGGSFEGEYDGSIQIGKKAKAGGYSVAIGEFSDSVVPLNPTGSQALAIGYKCSEKHGMGVVIGYASQSGAQNQTIIGYSIQGTNAPNGAIIIGTYPSGIDSSDKVVLGYGSTKYFNVKFVNGSFVANVAGKQLAFLEEVKPEGNPTVDSVVKVSSTGTTSYLGIDTTATSASANLVTSGAVAAVESSLSQSIAGCASEPDISTFPENDDAFFIGEKTSHASKWLPKKQMTLKSHKIHFDAFDSGSTVGQYDDAFISVLCYTETHFTVDTLTTFMLATGQSYPVCSPSYGMVGYVRVSNAVGEITWEDKEGNNIALAGINENSYVVIDIQSFFPFE